MAGVYDLISGDQIELSVHFIRWALIARSTGAYTVPELQAFAEASMGRSLVGDEITDFTAIFAAIDAEVGALAKLVFLEKFESSSGFVEMGLETSEVAWRSKVGIPAP